MITRNIRDFVNRDWAEARASKDAYWGDRIARLGPLEAFRIAEELRQQMRLNDPSWPDDASRRQDVLDHVRFAERLRRAGSARRG